MAARCRRGAVCLLLLAGLACGPDIPSAPAPDNGTALSRLQPGMTAAEVRKVLKASPRHVCRQVLYQRYREQWLYDSPEPLRLTFDWHRGELPRLLETDPPLPPTHPHPATK